MKLTTILALVLLAHTSGASTGAASSAEDEIKKLEEIRNQAVLHGDVAALDRMTSDD